MSSWPAGSSIVFDGESSDGTKLGLTAIRYKYNKKKTHCFIMTENAGSTLNGVA